jgi:hypothetical protein
MKNLLLIPILFFVQIAVAQKDSANTKPKNHSIGLYTGVNAFQTYNVYRSYNPDDYTYQTLNPYGPPSFMSLSNLFSLSYKYKKHEIIPVLYLSNYLTDNNKSKTFLLGGALSYLYHFNQKRAHLFFETNLQALFYTMGGDGEAIRFYGSNQNNADWIAEHFHTANIQTYILNVALGLEVKLWPLTYLQFACGSGAYYTKGKPATSPAISAQWGMPDVYQNTYPGVFGANWYGRLSIIVRGLNF